VAILEEPVKGGSLLFVSGDGRDKAMVWTCGKRSDIKEFEERVIPDEPETTTTDEETKEAKEEETPQKSSVEEKPVEQIVTIEKPKQSEEEEKEEVDQIQA